jgi:hypothetical protein
VSCFEAESSFSENKPQSSFETDFCLFTHQNIESNVVMPPSHPSVPASMRFRERCRAEGLCEIRREAKPHDPNLLDIKDKVQADTALEVPRDPPSPPCVNCFYIDPKR